MSKVYHRTITWTVERPCIWHVWQHNEDFVTYSCFCCGIPRFRSVELMGIAEYELTIEAVITPGCPAYTPPGDGFPTDPPEPPRVELCSIKLGTAPFPWTLTQAEEDEIIDHVLETEGE